MNAYPFSQQSFDYQRIEQAIRFVESHVTAQPDLDEIADHVHVSKYHFQRLFKRWVGISPTQFLQFLTLEYTKEKLAEGRNLLDVSYDAGLSGPGRLHDLFVTFEAMTPGEYKNMGAGLQIEYGFHPTPFGECLLAVTERGICHLSFVTEERRDDAFADLQSNWTHASFQENAQKTDTLINQIFASQAANASRPFHLLVKGTNFQVNVWQALLSIPKGTMVSYQDIAAYLGKPKSTRAVANAIAINPVGYLIPCHRVITKNGQVHQYRWGSARKKAILGWEAADIMQQAMSA
ncbi:methylated DNA-protein cysteine methyltransferase [Candidatus Vecturithrix granuli]|uniref:methylated-DNA--[protein]-cysteine S-methyltransferase n=1 Tax=Vecturithrix granuli TaxID=1499967 RepID=A0A081BXD5_VECG1|nr:methylated DNA-protein cysteine methyltransferase [Candidatus Vecturithrix granuli]